MLRTGHPDRRELTALIGLGQFLGVAAVRLHFVAWLLGDERRRDDLAVDAQFRELPVERVAGGTGLVADLQVPAPAELLEQFPHGFGTVEDFPETANPTAPFGDGRGDGFGVNIET